MNAKQLIMTVLNEMKNDNMLTEESTGVFKFKVNTIYVTGTIDLTAKGTAYLISDDCKEDVFIPQVGLNHALNGDKVKVLLYARSSKRRPEGEVVEILERKKETFVGIIQCSKQYAFLVPTGKQLPYDIFIPLTDRLIQRIPFVYMAHGVRTSGIIAPHFNADGNSYCYGCI